MFAANCSFVLTSRSRRPAKISLQVLSGTDMCSSSVSRLESSFIRMVWECFLLQESLQAFLTNLSITGRYQLLSSFTVLPPTAWETAENPKQVRFRRRLKFSWNFGLCQLVLHLRAMGVTALRIALKMLLITMRTVLVHTAVLGMDHLEAKL